MKIGHILAIVMLVCVLLNIIKAVTSYSDGNFVLMLMAGIAGIICLISFASLISSDDDSDL
jgi:hypothetical protein